jgi:enoyl-CoA hydratase/carnithine racemase
METLLRTDDGGVTTLALNRPDRRNALTTDLLRTLLDQLDAVQDSPSVRVVVLAGSGGVFCAGADLNELAGSTDPHAAQRRIRLVTTVIDRLRNLEQPTIAAVSGAAYGAGWGLSLACDLTYATADAAFCLPEVRKGLRLPTAITSRLVEVVGPVRAAEIALTGATFSAAQGVDAGWVARTATAAGLPAPAVRAYADAELVVRQERPSCHLSWNTLAGIGWVESQHGTIGGRTLAADGRSSTPILGPALDGSGGFAAIH